MKQLTRGSHLFHQCSRLFSTSLAFIFLLLCLGSCGLQNKIDDVINEVDKTRQTIASESSGWRDELTKLANDLNGMESNISADAKGILADTTNQVQDLATQTIQLSDAKAQDLISQAGVEFRCNADFVKAGAVAQLQAIVDDLKFWKQNKKHSDKKPPHAVCWINPSALALYPSGNNWLIDTSNMSEKNIVHVFGYNFWGDRVPTLELQDASGNTLRKVNLTAAYVTHYQINLDFSNEQFPDVKPGARAVFRWPDQDDPNTINLILRAPAKLELSNAIFTPPSPIATQDSVTLQVTVINKGGSRSGNFAATWKPDPTDNAERSVSQTPVDAGASVTLSFPPYTYQRDGLIPSVVSLSTGDEPLRVSLTVVPLIQPIRRYEYVDTATVETYGGTTIHACPPGYAMGGAHVNDNKFLCRRIMPEGEEKFVQTVLDSGTQRSDMHACPPGTYMRGLHANNNWLLCSWDSRRTPPSEWQQESVDTSSNQYGMHVCPRDGYPTYLTGIHVIQNRFLCGVHYRADVP